MFSIMYGYRVNQDYNRTDSDRLLLFKNLLDFFIQKLQNSVIVSAIEATAMSAMFSIGFPNYKCSAILKAVAWGFWRLKKLNISF